MYNIVRVPKLDIDPNNNKYVFGKKRYCLQIGSIDLALDITVNETLPVDDFDVNCLTFHYKWGNPTLIAESFDKDKLCDSIHKKEMTMLPSYFARLSEMSKFRINSRFLSKGWQIKYGDIDIQEYIRQDDLQAIKKRSKDALIESCNVVKSAINDEHQALMKCIANKMENKPINDILIDNLVSAH